MKISWKIVTRNKDKIEEEKKLEGDKEEEKKRLGR
jgi:hypothetical protein